MMVLDAGCYVAGRSAVYENQALDKMHKKWPYCQSGRG